MTAQFKVALLAIASSIAVVLFFKHSDGRTFAVKTQPSVNFVNARVQNAQTLDVLPIQPLPRRMTISHMVTAGSSLHPRNKDSLQIAPHIQHKIVTVSMLVASICSSLFLWTIGSNAQRSKWSTEAASAVRMDWRIATLTGDKGEPAPPSGPKVPLQAYLTLASLLAIYISNQWSRQVINYIFNFSSTDTFLHMNAALDISREQYAVLSGAGFTVFYALMSLVAGSLADRGNRKKVAVISAVSWSAATALQALCTSFSGLAVLRAVQGISQAFCTPAAYTLIADSFPKNIVASMNGIYGSAIYFGGALASLGILLDNQYGWRSTTVIIGAFGILTALAGTVFIQAPDKGQEKAITSSTVAQAAPAPTVLQLLGTIASDSRAVLAQRSAQLIFLASAFRFCAGFSIGVWKAPFIFEKFPELATSFGAINAGVISIGGFASSLLGGFLADRIFTGRKKLFVPAVGSLLAVPTFALFVTQPDFNTALFCLFLEYLVAECWFGPTLASLYDSVPQDKRGSAQGLFSTLTAFGTIAPIVVGSLASQAGNTVGDSLLWVVGGTYFVSAMLFAIAAVVDDTKA